MGWFCYLSADRLIPIPENTIYRFIWRLSVSRVDCLALLPGNKVSFFFLSLLDYCRKILVRYATEKSGNRLYTHTHTKTGKMIYGQVHLNIIQTTLSTTYIKESSPARFWDIQMRLIEKLPYRGDAPWICIICCIVPLVFYSKSFRCKGCATSLLPLLTRSLFFYCYGLRAKTWKKDP